MSSLEAADRRAVIVEQLEKTGRVAVGPLADACSASEMTIRRDLEALERDGVARRVHGGAVSLVSRSYEPPFAARARQRTDAKVAIGRAAAALLGRGETVVLDAGTTTLEVARALREAGSCTVCPLSLQAAALLADVPSIRLIVPGGEPRPGEGAFIGELPRRALAELHFDTYVLAIGGITAAEGITDFDLDDIAVKRVALASARRVIAVADGKKVGQVAFAVLAPAGRLDVLVTDASAPADEVQRLRDAGVEVVTA
jgi:DeoR/GlpR family transcriptional regulator of sugar metabolism